MAESKKVKRTYPNLIDELDHMILNSECSIEAQQRLMLAKLLIERYRDPVPRQAIFALVAKDSGRYGNIVGLAA